MDYKALSFSPFAVQRHVGTLQVPQKTCQVRALPDSLTRRGEIVLGGSM